MKETKTYDNRRRVAMALLRQLGTVRRMVTTEYVVKIPKAITRIPSLRRQVKKALRTLDGKVVLK